MIVFDTRKSIRQAALWLALCASLVMTWSSAAAQQGRRNRIGVLDPAAAKNVSDRLAAFKRGLREFGYIEGQNIASNIAIRRETQNVYRILRLSWYPTASVTWSV
jgi:hypothetical protein